MHCDNAYYELLGVSPTASLSEIKRAFRRRALVVHPDRNPSEDAHGAFQRLRAVYDVLVDESQRALYDECGESAVDGSDDAGADAAFWASAGAQLTEEDIIQYEAVYPDSAEEKEDLRKHFERFDGGVERVLDYIPFSEATDIRRFLDFWDGLVEEGAVEGGKYDGARKVLEKAGKKAEKAAKKKSGKKGVKRVGGPSGESAGDVDPGLLAIIQGRAKQREKAFDEWADSLAEPPVSKKRKRKGKA